MRILIFILACLPLVIPCKAETIIVDPNGSADFTNIQDAINYSWDGDTVIVRPGTYIETIYFNGRAITLTSENPDDEMVVDSTVITSSDVTVAFEFCETSDSVITGFTIVGPTAIEADYCLATPSIVKNIILGTSYGIRGPGGTIFNNVISGGVYCKTEATICNNVIVNGGILLRSEILPPPIMIVKNNIIAWDVKGIMCDIGKAVCENSFNCFWDIVIPFYGDVTAGPGDIYDDPLFVDSANGDYHLKSEQGRWDSNAQAWIFDDVTSRCIDAGDPCDPIGVEPNPNGGRINIGAYGGTAQASKSTSGIIEPVCTEYPAMDFNKDCKVDFKDFALFTQSWLDCNLDPPEACWE